MSEKFQESIRFFYTSNGRNIEFSLKNEDGRLNGKDVTDTCENFLVACGFAEPKSYVNSKDLIEKIRQEHKSKSIIKKNDRPSTGTN